MLVRPLVVLLALLAVGAADAADSDAPDARAKGASPLSYGGDLVVGSPTGAFAHQVSVAGGLAGFAVWTVRSGVLGLRVDGGFALYGSETVRVPVARQLSRISVDVTTDNWIAHLGAGPQLMVPSGPLRPYANAFAGVSYFSTTSEATADYQTVFLAGSTNHDDTVLSWGGGAGIVVPLGSRRVALDAGARYVRNRRVSYLVKGDLHDDGHGGVAFTPHHGSADLVEFRLGVTVVR